MTSSAHNNRTTQYTQDELDTFLSSIESKMRPQFAAVDLPRAARLAGGGAAAASSSSSSSSPVVEFLEKLLETITKSEKIMQCKMLIGLLGIEDTSTDGSNTRGVGSTNPDMDENANDNEKTDKQIALAIAKILEKTQAEGDGNTGSDELASNKEWIRVVSGLCQGILFRPPPPPATTTTTTQSLEGSSSSGDSGNDRESCRGKEAADVISKLGSNVCRKVDEELKREMEHHHRITNDNGSSSSLNGMIPPDLNACFAPYRYSLISTQLLNTIIPEFDMMTSQQDTKGNPNGDAVQMTTASLFDNNCHFRVNASASILHEDEKLEQQRAMEQLEHGVGIAGGGGVSVGGMMNGRGTAPLSPKSAEAAARREALPANFRPTNLTSRSASARSSTFVPDSRGRSANAGNSRLFNTSARRAPPMRAMLNRRGGAQQQMNRSRAGGASAIGRSSQVTSGATSSRLTALAGSGRVGGGRSRHLGGGRGGRMQMIDVSEAADLMQRDANPTALGSGRKRRAPESSTSNGMRRTNAPNPRSNIALNAGGPIQDGARSVGSGSGSVSASASASASSAINEDLTSYLQTRNNKLSDDDRVRIQQFMEGQPNPTSDQGPTYKIKVHEARQKDASGNEVKKSFYVELDYNTYGHTYSTKIKRY